MATTPTISDLLKFIQCQMAGKGAARLLYIMEVVRYSKHLLFLISFLWQFK